MNSANPNDTPRRLFEAGLEAARRLRGIPTPHGVEPSDERDVMLAMQEIERTVGRVQLEKYAAMRAEPLEVRMQYKTPGRDTLARLTGVDLDRWTDGKGR